MNKEIALAKYIAEDVSSLGGTAYYVGGYVRDKLIGIKNKDIDIEVFGIHLEDLKNICSNYGIVDEIGASDGLNIHGYNLNISIPRLVHKINQGLDDAIRDAARRRDFTINSIMQDILTNEYLDPYHGLQDLNNLVLRHIDEVTFVEDSLRVYRAAQFAARFHLIINPDTIKLCKTVHTSSLPKERIFEETNKALLKAKKPSIYFEALRTFGQLDIFFPILKSLIGIKQNPLWHPEGDVWNHSMEVIDKAAGFRDSVSYPLGFMYAALFHDIGKAYTTVVHPDGSIHSYGHDLVGAEHLKDALSKIISHPELEAYIENMVRLHMVPHKLFGHASYKSTNRFLDKCQAPGDSIMLSIADTINEAEINAFKTGWWDNRIAVYNEMKSKPKVTSKDLIDLGYEAEPLFQEILQKCHEVHLADISKDEIVKQLPSIIKGIKTRKSKK